MARGFPALGHKNFRNFLFGQCISLVGTWSQRTAQQWLVYSMTQSPLLLGFLGVAQYTPTLVFSLFAGVLVDRYPKKRSLIFTQSVMMAQALLLAALVWSGQVRYWQILLLAAVLGCIDTLDVPTRQSFFIELVGRKDLTGAIALNSAIVNAARIVGPAIAGLMMLHWGIAFCFLFNGFSFIAVLAGLLAIRGDESPVRASQGKMLAETRAGLRYIAGNRQLGVAVLAMLVVSTFAMNTNVLIPVLAKEILAREAGGFSLLLSAMGGGALLAALLISYGGKARLQQKTIFQSGLLLCLLLITFGMIRQFLLAMLLLFLVGICSMVFLASVNSTLQMNASDQFRGRTMSVYSLAFMGTTPIGNLFAGAVTQRFGPAVGFLACGGSAALFLAGLLLWLRRRPAR